MSSTINNTGKGKTLTEKFGELSPVEKTLIVIGAATLAICVTLILGILIFTVVMLFFRSKGDKTVISSEIHSAPQSLNTANASTPHAVVAQALHSAAASVSANASKTLHPHTIVSNALHSAAASVSANASKTLHPHTIVSKALNSAASSLKKNGDLASHATASALIKAANAVSQAV
jgi:cytoskeletal protein RodZ